MPLYCEVCCRTFDGDKCPDCGKRRRIREVRPDDLCFLTEKEYIWAEMLADVLTQQNIRFMQKSVMGAGLALKVGPILDRIRCAAKRPGGSGRDCGRIVPGYRR